MDDLKKGACLETKAILCSYSTGNNLGCLHFIWKVPSSEAVTEQDMVAGNAKAIREIEPSLPSFHTRAMRKQFFAVFWSARPAVLKEIYRQLTGKDVNATVGRERHGHPKQ